MSRKATAKAKPKVTSKFHMEFLNSWQKLAWAAFQQHDVNLLVGSAGTGKTYLSMAFAIHDILQRSKKKIIITRPIVEAGESLGFLPGDYEEKVSPYMMPLFDCMKKLIPERGPQSDVVREAIEIAPIAYMRGRTFDDSVCIFDEAQNATLEQLKMFLSRFGKNSKIIITGDPNQSDLSSKPPLFDLLARLDAVEGVAIVRFPNEAIVRHPLIATILEKLEN